MPHVFRYPLFMLFLDLSELEDVFRGRWLWSVKRWAVARFRREDHFGDPDEPLDVSVRRLVETETGRRPAGPIRVLTHLSYFGYCFNPVSFFYCYDERGEAIQSILAEVNNTPWGERHVYVLEGDDCARLQQEFEPKKVMHVSPFMAMNVDYRWRFTNTDRRLIVYMETSSDNEKIFDATLSLERREITGLSLARALLRHPLMTVRVITAIHWQAFLLWLKGATVYTHRAKQTLDQNQPEGNHSCKPFR